MKNNNEDQSILNNSNSETSKKFGTFAGVFTPSILTILGVIMYLRLGWVVGNVGLIGTLTIVTIASCITFITGLSVSSISTDQKVRTGGAYYMISRSLGIESGGALGIPLFIAQACSIPLYTIGFAESISLTFPGINQKIVAFIVTLFVAGLAIKSANIAIKTQFFIMAGIGLSLLSFFLGTETGVTIPETMEISTIEKSMTVGFWQVFAIFFPAVTGIMAGINMSGDLKNSEKSIPIGTIAAVVTGYIIYMIIPFFLYYRSSTNELINNPMIMYNISRWSGLILIGIWGATLSSAIGSILGAPRVLQALARDGILPNKLQWVGKGHGPADEPRIGTIITLCIALFLVIIGDLNMIAPILTMFFLATYLVLNLVAGIESFLKNQSFRPTLKVHWALSLSGALGCIIVMFMINPLATVIAALFILGIYIWLQQRQLESTWGDVRRGLWMMLIRLGLLQLDHSNDPKNWRPNILVLSGAPTKRWQLIHFSDMLTHQRGLFTVVTILPKATRDAEQKSNMEISIKEYINKRSIPALVRVISAQDTFEGAYKLVESYGLGAVVPNTVLLGATENMNEEIKVKYFNMIDSIHNANRNILILNYDANKSFYEEIKSNLIIDIWWGGLEGNGGLMLILANCLKSSSFWRNAELRLKLVVSNESAVTAAKENLELLLKRHKISANYFVINKGKKSFDEIFKNSSSDANLIFHGLPKPNENFIKNFKNIQNRLIGMPNTVLVLSGKNCNFYEIFQKKI